LDNVSGKEKILSTCLNELHMSIKELRFYINQEQYIEQFKNTHLLWPCGNSEEVPCSFTNFFEMIKSDENYLEKLSGQWKVEATDFIRKINSKTKDDDSQCRFVDTLCPPGDTCLTHENCFILRSHTSMLSPAKADKTDQDREINHMFCVKEANKIPEFSKKVSKMYEAALLDANFASDDILLPVENTLFQ